MDDPLLRAALKAQATLSFLRAQAAGCAREMGRYLHAQGCTCGNCDGTGKWPGGGVVAYSWLIDADGTPEAREPAGGRTTPCVGPALRTSGECPFCHGDFLWGTCRCGGDPNWRG